MLCTLNLSDTISNFRTFAMFVNAERIRGHIYDLYSCHISHRFQRCFISSDIKPKVEQTSCSRHLIVLHLQQNCLNESYIFSKISYQISFHDRTCSVANVTTTSEVRKSHMTLLPHAKNIK
jgi:hypothetical protein